jgi:hypothetical protein
MVKQSASHFEASIEGSPWLERVPATAHSTYILSADRVAGPNGRSKNGAQLAEADRNYNNEGVRTWSQEAQLFERFLDVILGECFRAPKKASETR